MLELLNVSEEFKVKTHNNEPGKDISTIFVVFFLHVLSVTKKLLSNMVTSITKFSVLFRYSLIISMHV